MASRRSCPSGRAAAGAADTLAQADEFERLACLVPHAPPPVTATGAKHAFDEPLAGTHVSPDGRVVEHVELLQGTCRLETVASRAGRGGAAATA